jgi:hypothetical protein
MLNQRCVAVVLGLAVLTGCGESGPVKSSGVVKWADGTPIGGASIRFVPKDKDKPEATGFSDAEGRFSLITGPKEGASRGEYTVVVTKFKSVDPAKAQATGETASAEDRIKAMQGVMKTRAAAAKNELPAIYADAAKSPLHVTIGRASEPIELTLKKS